MVAFFDTWSNIYEPSSGFLVSRILHKIPCCTFFHEILWNVSHKKPHVPLLKDLLHTFEGMPTIELFLGAFIAHISRWILEFVDMVNHY